MPLAQTQARSESLHWPLESKIHAKSKLQRVITLRDAGQCHVTALSAIVRNIGRHRRAGRDLGIGRVVSLTPLAHPSCGAFFDEILHMQMEPSYVMFEQFELDRFALKFHLRRNLRELLYHHRVGGPGIY